MADEHVACAILPFSHLDLFWLGSEEECLARGVGVIARALRLLDQDPDFRFLIEYMVFLDAYLDRYPGDAGRIRDLVQQGRLELGAQWSGIYHDFAQGEDIVRNTEYAVRFCQERLGATPTVAHLGDLPGYAAWFPELAVHLGIKYAIITRGGPKSIPLFWWEAPSGARILTWNATPVDDPTLGRFRGYAWARNARLHMGVQAALDAGLDRQIAWVVATLPPELPLLVHWGVDLMLPSEGLLAAVHQWGARHGITMAFATPTEHYHALLDGLSRNEQSVPVIRGAVPSLWPYQEAINFAIKGWEMRATHDVLTAEVVAAIASGLGLRAYPHALFDHAWKELLEAADHNLKGTGYGVTRERKRQFQTQAIAIAGDVGRRSLASLAGNLRTLPGHPAQIPIVVFNPLNWTHSQPVDIHVSFHGDPEAFDWRAYESMALLDDQGKETAFDVLFERRIITLERTLRFVASEVPGIGWRTWCLVPVGSGEHIEHADPGAWPVDRHIADGITTVTCAPYRIAFDGATGTISATVIVDNPRVERSTIDEVAAIDIEMFAEMERPGERDSWVRHLDTGRVIYPIVEDIRIRENSPTLVCGEVSGLLGNAPFTLMLRWCPGLPTIRLSLHLDWQGEPALRCYLRYRPRHGVRQVRYGVPFGSTTLDDLLMPDIGASAPDELPMEAWTNLRQMRLWADLETQGQPGGWTVTSEKATFRYGQAPGALDVVLARAMPSLLPRTEPADLRAYDAAFTVAYHAAPTGDTPVWRRGPEAMMPFIVHAEGQVEGARHLPATARAVHIEGGDALVVTSMRAVDDTLRVTAYNPTASMVPPPALRWMGAAVASERTDFQGRPLHGASTVGPSALAIVTAKLRPTMAQLR